MERNTWISVYYGKEQVNISVLREGTLDYQCITGRNTWVSMFYRKEHMCFCIPSPKWPGACIFPGSWQDKGSIRAAESCVRDGPCPNYSLKSWFFVTRVDEDTPQNGGKSAPQKRIFFLGGGQIFGIVHRGLGIDKDGHLGRSLN